MGSNEKPVPSLMYYRERCGRCQAGRITKSSLLVLLFPSVPPKGSLSSTDPYKNFFLKREMVRIFAFPPILGTLRTESTPKWYL